MKKSILIFLFFLCGLVFYVQGQVNLVPNPSFENVTQCPFSLGLETYISDWKSARETPDYFNSCATSSVASVPSNNFGYQSAFSGNGYIGMLTYRADSSIFTEAATVQLTSPLTIGQKYYVSFKLNLTLESITESNAANNKIGIQFSTVAYSPTSQIAINNFAHIWTDSIITDTLNWSTVTGSFIADSSYTHLVLGNFFGKPFVDSLVFGTVFGAYYYFDDICVSTDSLTCNQAVSVNETILNQSSFNLYPNPAKDYFTINSNIINEPYNLIIYNTIGQELYAEENINTSTKKISINNFNSNLLFIKIKTENQSIIYKLLKP